MAGKASSYHHGDMDIHEQVSTFHLVMNITKWGSLHLAALLVFLVLWFCTGAGFLAGLISAIVIMALGITFLRSKPDSGH
jgi:thiamine transporter ThiT